MGNKYTATISCDYELWLSFKEWAAKQNSSASKEISNFMSRSISGTERRDRQHKLNPYLEEQIKNIITLELERLGIETEKQKKVTNNTDNTGNTEETKNTDNTEDTETDNLLTDRELKREENLPQVPSTITRWRHGKGTIPQSILDKYEIVGVRWRRKS